MNLENFACVLYRFLKSQLDKLEFICPDIYNRTKCPACPQVHKTFSMYLYLCSYRYFGL